MKNTIFLLLITFFFACRQTPDKATTAPPAPVHPTEYATPPDPKPEPVAISERAEVEKITMEIHDQAMATLADMNRTERKIKETMKTLRLTEEGMARYTKVLRGMDNAEADMMTWMTQYKSPDGVSEQEALAYLKDQNVKIAKNRDDINAALAAGKALLNN